MPLIHIVPRDIAVPFPNERVVNNRRTLLPDPVTKGDFCPARLGTLLQSGGTRRQYLERNGAPSPFPNKEIVKYLNANKFCIRDIDRPREAPNTRIQQVHDRRRSITPTQVIKSRVLQRSGVNVIENIVSDVSISGSNCSHRMTGLGLKEPRLTKTIYNGVTKEANNGVFKRPFLVDKISSKIASLDSQLISEKGADSHARIKSNSTVSTKFVSNVRPLNETSLVHAPPKVVAASGQRVFEETLSERVKTRRRAAAKNCATFDKSFDDLNTVAESTARLKDASQHKEPASLRSNENKLNTDVDDARKLKVPMADSKDGSKGLKDAKTVISDNAMRTSSSGNSATTNSKESYSSQSMLNTGELYFDLQKTCEKLSENIHKSETIKTSQEFCRNKTRISHLKPCVSSGESSDFLHGMLSQDVKLLLNKIDFDTDGQSVEHKEMLQQNITKFLMDNLNARTANTANKSKISSSKLSHIVAKAPKKSIKTKTLMDKTVKQTRNIKRNINKHSKKMAHVIQSLITSPDETKSTTGPSDEEAYEKRASQAIEPLKLGRKSISDDWEVQQFGDKNCKHRKRKAEIWDFKIPKKSLKVKTGEKHITSKISTKPKKKSPDGDSYKEKIREDEKATTTITSKRKTSKKQKFVKNNLISDGEGNVENPPKKRAKKKAKKDEPAEQKKTDIPKRGSGANTNLYHKSQSRQLSKSSKRKFTKVDSANSNSSKSFVALKAKKVKECKTVKSKFEKNYVITDSEASETETATESEEISDTNDEDESFNVGNRHQKTSKFSNVKDTLILSPADKLRIKNKFRGMIRATPKIQKKSSGARACNKSALIQSHENRVCTVAEGSRVREVYSMSNSPEAVLPDWNGVLTVRMEIVQHGENDSDSREVLSSTPNPMNYSTSGSLQEMCKTVVNQNDLVLQFSNVRQVETCSNSVIDSPQTNEEVADTSTCMNSSNLNKDQEKNVASCLTFSERVASDHDSSDCEIIEVEKEPVTVVDISDDDSDSDDIMIVKEVIKMRPLNVSTGMIQSNPVASSFQAKGLDVRQPIESQKNCPLNVGTAAMDECLALAKKVSEAPDEEDLSLFNKMIDILKATARTRTHQTHAELTE